MVRKAKFTMVLDDGRKITTNCKVNLLNREVFDIKVNDTENLINHSSYGEGYVTIDGEEYDAYNRAVYDMEDNNEDFWYRLGGF